jgi:hypothetical protein
MVNRRVRKYAYLPLLVTFLFVFSSCPDPPPLIEEVLPMYQPTGQEATIVGKVLFQGEAPKQVTLQMDADDYCKRSNANPLGETLVVNDNKLQNVVVYLKAGTALKTYDFNIPVDAAKDVVLDQKGCRYTPHVISMMAKEQNLRVKNSDDTNHNVHPIPKNNTEWNQSQAPKGADLVETFAREDMIPVKCNIHPWMKAYIGVFKHPFHAVTKADGTFEIKGVPPGEYTLEAWHEKMPAQTQKVTVAEKETKTVEFTFKAETAAKSAAKNGVKFGSALILEGCCGK